MRSLIEAPPESPRFTRAYSVADRDGRPLDVVSYASEGRRLEAVVRSAHLGDDPLSRPLVFVHGHTMEPAAYSGLTAYSAWLDAFAAAGHFVVAPDLRHHGNSDGDGHEPDMDLQIGSTIDVINAIRAVLATPGVTADRVVIAGHSLGAVTALNVAVVAPELVSAVIAFSPANVSPWHNLTHFTEGTEFWRELGDRHGTIDASPRFWADVSPLTFADRLRAPILVMHGDADATAIPEWTRSWVTELRRAGADITAHFLPGRGHGLEAADDPDGSIAPETAIAYLRSRWS